MEEPPGRAGNPNANAPPPRSSDANPNRRQRPTSDATQIGKKLKVVSIKRFFSSSRSTVNIEGEARDENEIQSIDEIEAWIQEAQVEQAEAPQPEPLHQEGDFIKEFNQDYIISDPGLRTPIERFHPNIRDQVKRAYLSKGPVQVKGHNFPRTECGVNDYRSFQESWFTKYDWLEYSVEKNAAYCFYCFLFKEHPSDGQFGHDAFTKSGFNTWKNAYKALRVHVGGVDSQHNNARNACTDFKNQRAGIDRRFQTYGKDSEIRYKVRLSTALDSAKYLIKQGLPFRGHDESSSSLNKGNYLEMIDSKKEKNEDIRIAFDELCPENARMLSPDIQKDLAKACAEEVTKVIRDEIGGRCFSVLIDESRDISVKEQMAMIVRFVNNKGEVVERFLGLKHVRETSSEALKKAFVEMLGTHKMSIARIRGQGYDGASNMRGEFNGLQKLIRDENPYAFYIHCFAHQLQLVVVAVSECCAGIKDFFDYVNLIVTNVGASCKRKDLLTEKHQNNILDKLDSGEILSGRGQHQMTSLVRPGDTRWGSHFNTLLRIESMWDAILPVLVFVNQEKRRANNAGGLVHIMETFNFVFIMKMMLKLFRITNELSQCLQKRDQNIVQAMSLLVDVKERLVDLRNDGREEIFAEVQVFCDAKKIPIPSMDAPRARWGRSRQEQGIMVTEEHHYRVDTFYAAVDAINTEMDHRFNEVSSELLVCFSCLDPRDSFSKFNVDKLVKLAGIYNADFSTDDLSNIKDQLQTFIRHVRRVDEFAGCCDLGSLAIKMVQTERNVMFPLVYRLIELALLLPVATASVERAFSAMKIIKTDRRNKMDDDWLSDLMICYTEKKIFKELDDDIIMKRFQALKHRRMNLPRTTRRT